MVRYDYDRGYRRALIVMERIILHCDMDRFYCAVEEKHNPALRNIPFAVCGDPEMRHSIVMSANSIARQYGVRAGLRFSDANFVSLHVAKLLFVKIINRHTFM